MNRSSKPSTRFLLATSIALLVISGACEAKLPPNPAALDDEKTSQSTVSVSDRVSSSSQSSHADSDDLTTGVAVVIVRSGDRLDTLAKRYSMKIDRLVEMNPGLEDAKRLLPGSAIRVVTRGTQDAEETDLSIELCRGVRGYKRIALTFDAAWIRPKDLTRLLDTLKKFDVPASFFLTGIFMDDHPLGAFSISQAGFPIYNHTDSHRHSLKLSDEDICKELLAMNRKTVLTVQEETRPFWRPPFGERDERILRVAAKAGFRSVYWTIDSLDWMKDPPRTPETIFERVCKRPFQKADNDSDPLDGAIVLFHVGGTATAAALDRIVPYLREKGYRFVSLSELLQP